MTRKLYRCDRLTTFENKLAFTRLYFKICKDDFNTFLRMCFYKISTLVRKEKI